MPDAPVSEARLRDALLRAAELLAATTTARAVLQGWARLVDVETVPGVVREEALERLRAAGDPQGRPWRDVEAQLRRAWGAAVARRLDDIDPQPVAVTPAAQVHRAVADGAPVAVKVRRPGIEQTLRADLHVLDAAAALVAGFVPRLDLAALVAEVRERALDELDLEHEAATQRAFHRALRRDPELHVPAPRTDLAREDVLVAEWVQGRSVRALAGALPDERSRAAHLAARFFLGALHYGTAQAAPDPDDVLLLADGRLAVLDFGAVARVPPGRAALAADLLDALAEQDDVAGARALDALGWLPAGDAGRALALARANLAPLLAGRARLDGAGLRAVAERARAHHGDALALLHCAALPPIDLWPLRGVAALALLLARLGAEHDWRAVAVRALRDGW